MCGTACDWGCGWVLGIRGYCWGDGVQFYRVVESVTVLSDSGCSEKELVPRGTEGSWTRV